MISFKSAARAACLLSAVAFGVSGAQAKKHELYGSSGSSSSHGKSGSSSGHEKSGSSSSHGKSGSSSGHEKSGSSSSHGRSGSSSGHEKSGSSSSHGRSGSSSGHEKSGSSSSHGKSGSSSSHGNVIVHPTPAPLAAIARPATLVVNVPADAVVYLMDQRMTLTGTERRYIIPVRQANVDYTYEIRVEVVRNGRTLAGRSEQTVRAGQETQVSVAEVAAAGTLAAVASR